MSNNELETLRHHLEGKTVLVVESAEDCEEAICKITLNDGTAFRLFATDLGFWTEDTTPTGVPYKTLPGLFNDVGHHMHKIRPDYNFEVPEPEVTIDAKSILVSLVDGRIFEVDTSNMTSWERKVCSHPKATELIISACVYGIYWKQTFSKCNDDCPKDLYIK